MLLGSFHTYTKWKNLYENQDKVYYHSPTTDDPVFRALLVKGKLNHAILFRYYNAANPLVIPATFLTDFPSAVEIEDALGYA